MKGTRILHFEDLSRKMVEVYAHATGFDVVRGGGLSHSISKEAAREFFLTVPSRWLVVEAGRVCRNVATREAAEDAAADLRSTGLVCDVVELPANVTESLK